MWIFFVRACTRHSVVRRLQEHPPLCGIDSLTSRLETQRESLLVPRSDDQARPHPHDGRGLKKKRAVAQGNEHLARFPTPRPPSHRETHADELRSVNRGDAWFVQGVSGVCVWRRLLVRPLRVAPDGRVVVGVVGVIQVSYFCQHLFLTESDGGWRKKRTQ